MTKTNNYIDGILSEFYEIFLPSIPEMDFLKEKLQEVEQNTIKTCNSGRKMYQQGQKDKVKEVIKEIERKKEFSQFKLDKKLSKTLSMYYQGINDTMYDLIGFLKSLKEDK